MYLYIQMCVYLRYVRMYLCIQVRERASEGGFIDLRVAIVGNVDSGKSTIVGVLTSGALVGASHSGSLVNTWQALKACVLQCTQGMRTSMHSRHAYFREAGQRARAGTGGSVPASART